MANSIDGRIVDATTRKAVPGLLVEAIGQLAGDRIGEAESNADGVFSVPVDARRFKLLIARAEDVGFQVKDPNGADYSLAGSPRWNAATADQGVTLVVRAAVVQPPTDGAFSVQGVVTDAAGVAAVGLGVEASDHSVNGGTTIGTTTTGPDGRYAITYDATALGGKPTADLQVSVVVAGVNQPLAQSRVLYLAPPQAVIDLVVDRAAVPRDAEHGRLLANVQSLLADRTLADVDAGGVAYLAGRTGWDARTVAMAAQSARLSAQTQIPAEHYYAVMRSGLPGDPDQIHRLDDDALIRALKQGIQDGIIADDGSIDTTLRLHRAAAVEALRTFMPTGTVSTLGDMLQLRLNADQQSIFLETFRATNGDPDRLWTELAGHGLDTQKVAGLQTDALLGEFTRQNAPVVGRLTQQLGIGSGAELADRGFYRPEAWKDAIGTDVPEGLTAEVYAAGLAAQVARTFPARVTADLVRTDAVPVGDARAEVADFLVARGDKESIGIAPVHTWEGFDQLSASAKAGIQTVERIYQISPSDAAMTTLAQAGVTSAMDVVQYSPKAWSAKFGDQFPTSFEADLIYSKAQEVHTTALTIATTYLAYRGAPNVYSITGVLAHEAPTPAPQIAASATLEELFGSLDYCSCDACRSVLSPAAYLVELLEFVIDTDTPAPLENPQAVLLRRRPDLQHIGLTCENTNTALPYVDLVLEILEHWVVNGSLVTFLGHDTSPDAATADLLADPAYVIDSAYDTTKAAVYPSPLPFDAPLDQLRRLFEVWGSALPAALDVLGTPADARREWLRLNASELSILTDVTFRELPEYLGEPPATTIAALNAVIANAKTFCRRTDITYLHLAEILTTSRFVNPGIVLRGPLEALQVSLHQIQQRFDGDLTDPAFLDLLPDDLDTAPYGGNVLTWLDTNRGLIMGTITLTDTTPPDDDTHECDFGTFELRFALPDMTANSLTSIAYHRLLRFIRLWKKLGWSVAATEGAFDAFLHADPTTLTTTTIDAAFAGLLDRLAGFVALTTGLDLSTKKIAAWLALFEPTLDPAVRQDRLAVLLRLGTIDLAHLLEITGLDPFADDLGSDDPSLSRLVDAAATLKGSRLKVADVDYLLRHDDSTGMLTPTVDELQRGLRSLRDALTAVDTDLAVPVATADLGAAAAKMALVYDAVVVDRFLALVAGTRTYSAPLTTVEEAVPAPLLAIAPRLKIDPFHNALTSSGPLSAATRTSLDTATDALTLTDVENIEVAGDLATFKTDVKTALQALQEAADVDLASLGTDYPELKTLYDALAGVTDPAAQAAAIAVGILPELRASMRATALRTALTNVTTSDVEVVDAFLVGKDVLHADGDAGSGVLKDFYGLETPPDLGTNGTIELLLDPPSSDAYLLYVAAPTGTTVTLVVGASTAIPATATDADGELRSLTPLTFVAGTLVPVTVTLAGLPAGRTASLSWRTNATAKAPVPASRVYARAALATAQRSLVRLQKAVTVQKSLGLTAGEIGLGSDTAGFWSAIDCDGSVTPADLHAQWDRLAWLLWFTALKTGLEPEQDTFLRILRDPAAVNARGQLVIAGVMGWAEPDLTAVLTALGLTLADLAELHHLRRVREALDLVATTLQPAADLIAWAVPNPDGTLVRTLRETLRARMDPVAWRDSMQSVTDLVRNARRDALVAYILHHAVPSPEIETADELYEYFLVDVQMDSCMQTSRIRLALSTVQLFINRCLLNLEPTCSPDSINADHWAWMRRYRVWEANRKVFLYPENWLEPELRDGKSPFFRDLESELLKSDITQDLAETAYLHYLQKLEDIARLEIVGAYLEPKTLGTTDDDVLHVVGRTLGTTREHWYRRYEYGYWTAWEKISLNIQGDIVVPVIWKKRLFVFWTTTLVEAHGDPSQSPQDVSEVAWSLAARVNATVTLHRGEYFHGAWTSPKTTETTTSLTWTSLPDFDARKLRFETRTYTPPSSPDGPPLNERLEIRMGYRDGAATNDYILTFTSTNSAPLVGGEDPFWVYLGYNASMLELGRDPKPPVDSNSWVYADKSFSIRVQQPSEPTAPVPMQVLSKTGDLVDGFRVRPVLHDGANPWELPLFYTDERSVFFVSGDEQQYRESLHYFVDDFVLDASVLAKPSLREVPVRTLIPHPDDPVINPQWAVQVPGNTQFVFDGTTFDAGGVAISQQFHL